MSGGKVQGTQSFGRAMGVLTLISDAPAPPTLADLLKLSGLTRPTLYRIIATLMAEQLVVRSDDQRYLLGPRLIALAHRALAQNDIRLLAHDVLESLRDETGETVHLAVRSGLEMLYIDKVESTQTVRMASEVGTRVAMHSSSVGRAYLAALAPARSTSLIDQLPLSSFTKKTVVEASALETLIANTREAGYSFEEEQNEEGIACFGASIRDSTREPVAAISVSVPIYRLSSDTGRYWKPLMAQCRLLSERLGFGGGAGE